jgi:hypothetical protein
MIPKSGNRFSEQDHAQTQSWDLRAVSIRVLRGHIPTLCH